MRNEGSAADGRSFSSLQEEESVAVKPRSLFDREIIAQAAVDSFKKLNPMSLLRNPVIFVTEVGAALTTIGLFFRSGDEPFGFVFQVTLWLWFTVLFANFAEAMAEGRGKAQAKELRKTRTRTMANRLRTMARLKPSRRSGSGKTTSSSHPQGKSYRRTAKS